MYDISELKVGDIMICGQQPYRQLFYIHNIFSDERISSSGLLENSNTSCFNKDVVWAFDRKATPNEEHIFYDLIKKYRLKFDLNKGVQRN